MQIPSEVDVAIVGAGPAGLSTACTLRKNGINAIVLDASAEPSTASRATVIHSRTLEVLEDIGLTEKIIEQGGQVTKWTISDCEHILADLDFGVLDCKYPMIITLSQTETEALLRAKLKELGGAIFQDAKVTDVTDSGDKVQLQVSTSNTKTTVTASYVVAADGLKSSIRDSLGIEFKGGEYNASFVTADCKFSATANLRQDTVSLFFSPNGLLLLIPMPHDIWRVVATLDNAPKNADVALYQHLLDQRGFPGIVVDELVWSSRFHIHHRLAQHYRKGRVFLVGDAAHVHSPAGGQGMNIGIQDGAKLGQILSGALQDNKTSDADLDQYESLRRPVAQGVVAMTHRNTVIGTLKSPFLRILRNWFMRIVMSIPLVRYWTVWQLAELEH